MLDDASFYTFVPSAHEALSKPGGAKHRRKTSLLEQPTVSVQSTKLLNCFSDFVTQDSTQTNGALKGGAALAQDGAAKLSGPPKATVKRAQSYTDFHYAVKAVLRAKSKEQEAHIAEAQAVEVRGDLDFEDWYDSLEDGILGASNKEIEYCFCSVEERWR